MPTVPGYEVLEELGRGGMGVVYKARQLGLNRLVALKMIRAGTGAVTAERARFSAEAEAIARLRHPHVVQVHEIGEVAGQPYLALEYVGGGSLARKLAEAPLTPRQAAEMALLLARAVDDTHKSGVVHRDLKPGNVLLAADGTPKIGDFGLARLLDQDSNLTQTGAVLGTPAYMAPEQASGAIESVGPPADVYALGVVLYEMLTGGPPFRGTSPLDTLDQVRNRDPVPPSQLQPGVPRDLETICLKCLQKEATRRYGSAGELADDCSAFLQGKPIRARPAGSLERAAKWARRRPWIAGLSALVFLLVICGFVGALVYQSRLRKALDTAEQRRVRSDANYQKIQEAVTTLLVEAGEKDLAPVPEMEEARARLLERALQMFQSLLEGEDSPDPAVRRQVSRTLCRTADIYQMLGRLPEAERDARRGLELAEQLVAEFPGDASGRRDRVWAVFRLATVLAGQERSAEALEGYSRVVALAEELPAEVSDRLPILIKCFNERGNLRLKAGPDEAEADFRRALALLGELGPGATAELGSIGVGIRFNLGVLAQSRGRTADARAAYLDALAVLEPAVATARRIGNRHAMLVDVYHNLGVLSTDDTAEGYLLKALELRKQLFARNPRVTKLRRDLAGDYEVLATVYLRNKRSDLAVTHLTEAVGLRGELVGEHPERPEDAVRLANDYITLGGLYSQQNRRPDAARSYQKVVEVLDPLRLRHPAVTEYAAALGTALLFRANLHTEAGEWDRALASCDRGVLLLEEAFAKTPGDVPARIKLRGIHLIRSAVLRQLGRDDEARQEEGRARELEASESK